MEDESRVPDRNRHAVYSLRFHLVVVVKYRRKVLTGPVADRLLALTRRLFEEDWGLRVVEAACDRDHVHVLFASDPQTQLSKLVNSYKTVTSRMLRKEFPSVKEQLWGGAFWSPSYYLGSVGEVSEETVRRYVANQGRGKRPPRTA